MSLRNSIQRKILYPLLLKEQKKKNPHRPAYNFEQADKILLLDDHRFDEKTEALENLIQWAKSNNKELFLISITDAVESHNLLMDFPFKHFDEKHLALIAKNDLNYLGGIKSNKIPDILKATYHLMINLNFNHSFLLDFILLKTIAGLKVGIKGQNDEICDLLLEVKPDQGYTYYAQQIISYIPRIHQ